MKRFAARRPILALLTLLLGIAGLFAWLVGREVRREKLNQQLIAAILREDTDTALEALKQGADGNARNEKQTVPAWKVLWNRIRGHPPAPSTAPTALMLAFRGNFIGQGEEVNPGENPLLIDALLEHGAQPNVQDADGYTPLACAIKVGNNAVLRLLLEHGVNVLQSGSQMDTPLVEAAASPAIDADIVERMLEHGANPDGPGTNKDTPLEWAIFTGSPDKVRLLLRYHANPTIRMRALSPSHTVLSFAETNADSDPDMREIVRMLKNAGAGK